MPGAPRSRYIPRSLERTLRRAAREFPVVVLTGPRQSGKTTLLKHVFGSGHRYVSLEPTDVRAAAAEDPRGFLALHPPPVILDEVQHAPGLLPFVEEMVDARRSRAGQFLLTGSQNLAMSAAVTESLAGRAAMLRLLPLSWREIARDPDRALPWERPGRTATRPTAAKARGCGGRSCVARIRSSWPTRSATPSFGTRATSRPTWSGTSARCARWAISSSSGGSCAPSRPAARSSSTSRTSPGSSGWRSTPRRRGCRCSRPRTRCSWSDPTTPTSASGS